LRAKVLAAMLYYSGLSSGRGIRNRAQQERTSGNDRVIVGEVLLKPEQRERRRVAIDETKVQLCGRAIYMWTAKDLDSGR